MLLSPLESCVSIFKEWLYLELCDKYQPSKHVKAGHHLPASETPFEWRFACGQMLTRHCRMAWNISKAGSWADPEGGGARVRTSPVKSQVIWVSIGNKRLDPPEKVGPHWKMLNTFRNLEK